MNSSSRHLRAAASSLPEDARSAATHAMENTREYASQAFERAGEKMRDLSYGVRDIASRGASHMTDYAHATRTYVSEQPVKSALIAAAIGAGVAALVLALRRNSRRYDY